MGAHGNTAVRPPRLAFATAVSKVRFCTHAEHMIGISYRDAVHTAVQVQKSSDEAQPTEAQKGGCNIELSFLGLSAVDVGEGGMHVVNLMLRNARIL